MIPLVNINDISSLNSSFKIRSKFDVEIDALLQEPLTSSIEENLILSLIDLTSLDASDNDTIIEKMCDKLLMLEEINEVSNVAAICIYPVFVRLVSQKLKTTNLSIASVAGAFPSAQLSLHLKLKEVEWAISEGATEIDMVMSIGKLIEGNYQDVFDELVAVKKCCGEVPLKIIIESGALRDNRDIRMASDIAMYAGANFIKTSTGKIKEGASYNSVYVMLNAIKDFYKQTGKKVGIKPSGGIANLVEAKNYLKLTEQILGQEWLSNELFRFGATSLAKNVLDTIANVNDRSELKDYFK